MSKSKSLGCHSSCHLQVVKPGYINTKQTQCYLYRSKVNGQAKVCKQMYRQTWTVSPQSFDHRHHHCILSKEQTGQNHSDCGHIFSLMNKLFAIWQVIAWLKEHSWYKLYLTTDCIVPCILTNWRTFKRKQQNKEYAAGVLTQTWRCLYWRPILQVSKGIKQVDSSK